MSDFPTEDELKSRIGYTNYAQLPSKFAKLKKNSDRVKFFENLLTKHGLHNDFGGILRKNKSEAVSEQSRVEGNEFFVKKQFQNALESYNRSLCFAKPGSELIGLAFANRSAVFLELKLFKLCLDNIEKARKHNVPAKTFSKLDNRQERCLEMINKGVVEISGEMVGAEYFKLSHEPNPDIPFIANCLKLEKNAKYGRFITTTKRLNPGDIISMEEPFARFLNQKDCYRRCATCLKENFLNLHPCSTCTITMFCSEECEQVGNRKFHQFECPIVDMIYTFSTLQLTIRTFFEALDVCNGDIEEFKTLVRENSPSFTVFDFKHPDRKNLLKAIDAHEHNQRKRGLGALMVFAGPVAFCCKLLVQRTKLGELLKTENDRDFLRSYIFKQFQITLVNGNNLWDLDRDVFGEAVVHNFANANYPFSTLVNHSCAPNVIKVTPGDKHCMIVQRVIEEGQQIFLCYDKSHFSMSKKERQEFLLGQFSFKCDCEACVKDYPLISSLGPLETPLQKSLKSDHKKVSLFDYKHAKEKFETNCQLFLEYDSKYPCNEFALLGNFLYTSYCVFTLSEFKIKLLTAMRDLEIRLNPLFFK